MKPRGCYFCGSRGRSVGTVVRGDDSWTVGCLHCKTEGPSSSTEEGAIFMWNGTERQDWRIPTASGCMSCPWCRSTEISVVQVDRQFRVTCPDHTCQARGPLKKTEDAAIEAWNFPTQ